MTFSGFCPMPSDLDERAKFPLKIENEIYEIEGDAYDYDKIVDKTTTIDVAFHIDKNSDNTITTTTPCNSLTCLVCYTLLEDQGQQRITRNKNEQLQIQKFLFALSKIFKFSPETVYKNVDLSSLSMPLYCSTCNATIFEVLSILREIENLQSRLTARRNEVKRQLFDSFRLERLSNISVEKHPQKCDIKCRSLIRKCYVQCLTPCAVELEESISPVLSPLKFKSKSKTEALAKARKSQNYRNDERRTILPDPDPDPVFSNITCGDNDVDLVLTEDVDSREANMKISYPNESVIPEIQIHKDAVLIQNSTSYENSSTISTNCKISDIEADICTPDPEFLTNSELGSVSDYADFTESDHSSDMDYNPKKLHLAKLKARTNVNNKKVKVQKSSTSTLTSLEKKMTPVQIENNGDESATLVISKINRRRRRNRKLKRWEQKDADGNTIKLRFTCKICDRGYNSIYHFKLHQLIHSGKKNTRTAELIKREAKLHSKYEKKIKEILRIKQKDTQKGLKFRFVCDQCGKGYKQQDKFESHKACHEVELRWLQSQNQTASLLESELKLDHLQNDAQNSNNSAIQDPPISINTTMEMQTEEPGNESSDSDSDLNLELEFPFTCSVCNKGFDSEIQLNVHMDVENHVPKNTYEDETIKERKTDEHEPEINFVCSQCPSTFSSAIGLGCHERLKHPTIPFEQVFSTEGELDSFRCLYCCKLYDRNNFTNSLGKFRIKCDEENCCGRGRHYTHLKNFMKHHFHSCTLKPSGKQQYVCQYCSPQKEYSSSQALQGHIISVHTKKFEYCCEQCGLGLRSKYSLRQHMAVHREDRPFICDLCGKSYKTKKPLVDHMKRHNDDLPFSCTECGKRFLQEGHLKCHEAVHTNIKNYPCSICGKVFASQQYVWNHVYAVHDKKRPWKPRRRKQHFSEEAEKEQLLPRSTSFSIGII